MASRYLLTLAISVSAHVDCLAKDIHVDQKAGGENFLKIGDALKAAAPGDTITVHTGVYRESIRMPAGEPDKFITLEAAAGERVVLSGTVPIKEWRPRPAHMFQAKLDFKPGRLFSCGREAPLAREPDEGWWKVEKADDLTITDTKNLKNLGPMTWALRRGDLYAYIWASHGNTFYTVKVKSLDREKGTITVDRKSKWMKLSAGDRYYLKGCVDLMDRPDEWAVAKIDDKYTITAKSSSKDAEVPREQRRVIGLYKSDYVKIKGLEVFGSAKNGIEVNRSRHVVIEGCISHFNGGTGIAMRDVRDITVRRCISANNYCGVTLHTASGAVVEESEIARNGMDGLIVSWNSSDVTARRNYIHHHLLWGHPDNVQLYRGVKGLKFEDNLLVAGGQSVMMEETSDGVYRGNMLIGSGAVSLIFGHKNARDYKIHNNTIAFAGYGCMSLTASGYDVRENVFMTGTGGCIYGIRGVKGYRGSRNLFFNATGLDRVSVIASDKGWHKSFAQYRKATGYDRDSVYGDPGFRNAPASYGVVDSKRIADCTRDTLYLRRGSAPIKAGETVEIDFDGVARKVVSVDGAEFKIAPPLSARPAKGCLVCNWRDGKNLKMDLRLAEDSPGAKLAADGGPVGSKIDIQAYVKGDFDGDGKRDLPEYPGEGE